MRKKFLVWNHHKNQSASGSPWSVKEYKRRRARNKVAKQARKRNRRNRA